MPYKTSWIVDKRVILIEYIDTVTIEDVEAINENLRRYAEEGIAPIHMVSDHTQMGKVKLELKTIQSAFTILGLDVWGYFVMVGADTLTSFFASMIGTMSHINLKSRKNRDQALDFLRQEDHTMA